MNGTGESKVDGKAVVLRPRKVLIAAWIGAVLVAGSFAAVSTTMTEVYTGVYFRLADQLALVVLGVILAGVLLLAARPRAKADAAGIEVRNILVTRYLPWSEVRRVAFPDGAPWARLELADDEYIAVMAVQAVDRDRAVAGIRTLRALHAAATRPT